MFLEFWRLGKAAQFVEREGARKSLQWVRMVEDYLEATDGHAVIRVAHSIPIKGELYFRPLLYQPLPKSAVELEIRVEDEEVMGAVFAKNQRELGPLHKYFEVVTGPRWMALGNRWMSRLQRFFDEVADQRGEQAEVKINASILARFQAFDTGQWGGVRLVMAEGEFDPIAVYPHGTDHDDEWYGLIMPMRD